jgi:hypothetical protein
VYVCVGGEASCNMVQYMLCGVVWCGVVWCGVVDDMRCGVVSCSVVWCS